MTDTSQNAPEKTKTQKALRSLNEVLGKAAPSGKATPGCYFFILPFVVNFLPIFLVILCVFSTSGSKVSSIGQDKSARKASAVISIFDDSSREGSDNSQDDEQFRARREFLKSGLPESFRKQMAKTAATKEAYSASSSSFQPVSHTTQSPIGRILSHSCLQCPRLAVEY